MEVEFLERTSVIREFKRNLASKVEQKNASELVFFLNQPWLNRCLKRNYNTEAKRCFATHDEDIILICVYILF